MTPKPTKDEGPFAVVFESLRVADVLVSESAQIRLLKLAPDDDSAEWEKIDELRRLSESMAEPELRTYTIS